MENNDYILRSDALKAIRYENWREENRVPSIEGLHLTKYQLLAKAINDIHAADVEPKRKTGYWLPHYDDEGHRFGYICSECGVWYVFDDLNGAHYCMNCGAKMDGEEGGERDDGYKRGSEEDHH